MNELTTEVLIVGGGTGGTAAAIQAARRGAQTILVSEFSWLGGMLTSAGVSAPDGNELTAWQTGIWGAYLRELQQRQPGGLDNSWVSFFSYDPRIGAKIFADWVEALPNLQWIAGQIPLEVIHQGNLITGVRFTDITIHAQIILDGTELGDVLALGDVPYRWGWEMQSEWGETSAPTAPNTLTQRYPVQAPTWVVVMQDFGQDIAPEIPSAPNEDTSLFAGAMDGYGAAKFLNYGRLPGGLFMINWPIYGNDYGEGVGRLVKSHTARCEFLQECLWHSQNFVRFIQTQLGRRYGLANHIFPTQHSALPTAFALHPYYRESRRLVGLTTLREQDILPIPGCQVAPLQPDSIAVGNYPNDHHYPGVQFPLQPKSMRWGGRWTGTPFTIPYGCLVPATTDGLLVCEKNISVSHIANGATRLQPVVLAIGQSAGMAAALCLELGCQPRDLPVKTLQAALIADKQAPAAIIPLFISPHHPDWQDWQQYYLNHPAAYPPSSDRNSSGDATSSVSTTEDFFSGIFHRLGEQDYRFSISQPQALKGHEYALVTLLGTMNAQLQALPHLQEIYVWGRLNLAGNWLLVTDLTVKE